MAKDMKTENKMDRLKNRFMKLHEKIQDTVEDFQDQVQNKMERSKISKFISHLSEDKSSVDSTEDGRSIGLSSVSSDRVFIPTLVFDVDPSGDSKDVCENFLSVERNEGIPIRKCLSATNLSCLSDGVGSSSESCYSCMTSSDDSAVAEVAVSVLSPSKSASEIRPRAGSLPPEGRLNLDLPTAINTCTELIEKFGNRFPSFKSGGDRIHRYLLKNTRLSDVNKRLKAQIWSSVVTIVLVEAKNLPAMDMDTRSSDPYCKFRLGNEKYKSKVVWKSLHPSWLEQFDLHLYDDQEQILEVTVWDKDKQTKDDFLGRCTIDLSKLEREKTHNIWQDLEDGNGQIFLLLTISGTTQSETITDLTSYRENPKDIEIIERRYTWYRVKEQAAGAGWLCVKVYGAAGLAAADLGGKSDPFCVLELGNARLQTHTEYKTLAPNWMKIFTFTVKDICSYLELTVYDEDHDHKVEFLGKLTIPLLTIRNGEKRWYALKDKKMRARAKGNYPQILLEMTVIWNPLKAAIRAVNPKEPKYMHQEAKFKRQLFIRNVMRLKAIIMWFIEIGKILQDCFEWESKLLSFMGLLAWLAFCYYYEMWMLPFLLLVFFSRNWLIYRLTVRLKRSYKSYKNNPWEYIKQIFGRGNPLLVPVDDDDLLAEEDDEDEADKEEKKSLKERLQAIQEVTQTVQNAIGYVASFGEAVKNLMNFTVPYLSYLAILMLFGAMIVLYIIPLRYLLMAWGINKFTRKILRPHTIPNNEVIDLLSRVPDDEILLDCRELKPHPINENRRDLRKKHKAS
ncbi:multiple C2 and transmembrane domain-containing protein isoform X5 [Plodia interpunctella]|uniref:multiple C2 and transmembrane domain-containing protein isoform X5 n=1 Tax=Plodia interpunctella TaxID=58824 RepID=UPI002367EB15|nr:multiple C2 and transmembrane domain-containing protein isoform X5 [Plodia interpunctella]XP_053619979.1 multiple C2 and transmembrane domain-containing protein isoform X5 [Plodia interpunctella]XP_053619980.1 multiple C2 and transmembrane domain-containing protein isoform X5 [Plodia interpunctella]XP_053619981.1 multiple C2 and transmembrane domain-containing protein isoform X5 [Plodia interpunctella]XP_053619982.1 multiple C2 and transmembrane domain-containing protein isoform X5 [Plodia i